MARPRVIRTKDGGEITLKNVDPALADAVHDLIKGLPPKPVVVEDSALTHKALGTCRDKDGMHWCVAEVVYNPLTKQAKVEKVTRAGLEKEYAIELFKINAAKNEIV